MASKIQFTNLKICKFDKLQLPFPGYCTYNVHVHESMYAKLLTISPIQITWELYKVHVISPFQSFYNLQTQIEKFFYK